MDAPLPGFFDEEPTSPPSQPTRTTKTDTETIVLRGVPVPLASDVGGAFVSDAARNKERLFSDARICEKYGLSMNDWKEIAKNKAFRLAVDAESERRTYNGDSAREAAAKQFVAAPNALAEILNNKQASPRHRISAASELRAIVNTGPESSSSGDTTRFVIHIDLGEDRKLVIDRQIAPLTPEEARETSDADAE
jgi:hypothetical protein